MLIPFISVTVLSAFLFALVIQTWRATRHRSAPVPWQVGVLLVAVNSTVGWDAQRWLLTGYAGVSALRVSLVWVQLVVAYGIVAVLVINWVRHEARPARRSP